MRFKFTLQHVYLSILLAFIIATPVGASSTTEPGATVTSLPPASTEGNNTDPCAFSDRQSLINRIDGNFERYNISLLVESCPNVCLLVFGAGNPDMSGIGAMVSYLIQGIAVFFFGPVIAITALVFRLDLSSEATRKPGFTTLLAKIALGINQGASFIALSICIACVIRIKQAPPMAEIFFIAWLGRFQFFVSIGAVWASWLLYRFDHRRVISILGCFALVYVMLCISESMSSFPTSQGRTFETFSHHCIKESRYLFAMDAKNAKVKIFNLKTRLVLIILLIVPITFMATYRFFQGAVSSLAVYFNTSPSRIMTFVFVPPYTVIWIYQCSEMALNLYHLRREIKRFAGDLYQDEQWGFGQVTILLLWASVVNDIVLGIMDYYWQEEIHLPKPDIPLRPVQVLAGRLSIPESLVIDNPPSSSSSGAQPEDINIASQSNLNQNPESHPTEPQTQVALPQPSPGPGSTAQTSGIVTPLEKPLEFGPQLRQRTWPRNEGGTYLPTVRS